MAVKQQGASLTLGTDGGSWKITNISRLSGPIPVIDDTDLSTTSRRTKIPGELADFQSVTVTAHGKPDATWPTKGLVQTITITGPLLAFTTAEKWAGTAFITDIKTPEFGSDTEAIQTIEIDIMFDGKTGPARTAAA